MWVAALSRRRILGDGASLQRWRSRCRSFGQELRGSPPRYCVDHQCGGTTMTYPIDPNYRPQPEPDPGLTVAAWISVAFVVLLFGGVAIWAFYSDPATT